MSAERRAAVSFAHEVQIVQKALNCLSVSSLAIAMIRAVIPALALLRLGSAQPALPSAASDLMGREHFCCFRLND